MKQEAFRKSMGLDFVEVVAFGKEGKFQMGGTQDSDEKPIHKVTLTVPYAISRYAVSFSQYDAYCLDTGKDKPDDRGWGRGSRPVIEVSWYEAVKFCNWLSRKEGLEESYSGSGDSIECNFRSGGYRLPTEAEWEYAARGGSSSRGYEYAGSNNLDEVGWYSSNGGYKTYPVGQKKPNELGLYDMSGNVYEWCWDWFDDDYYGISPAADPQGSSSGSRRVIRGGSWYDYDSSCRSAYRDDDSPGLSILNVGFRLVRSLVQQ